jgi:cytochrome c oxidase subunit 2
MQASEINVMIFWICVAIGIVVYAAIIWSLVAYRKGREHETSFHKHTATEIAWTVIPLIIIIAMTIPAAKLLTKLYHSDGDNELGSNVSLFMEEEQPITKAELI